MGITKQSSSEPNIGYSTRNITLEENTPRTHLYSLQWKTTSGNKTE